MVFINMINKNYWPFTGKHQLSPIFWLINTQIIVIEINFCTKKIKLKTYEHKAW
jgi:hypothetical protein